MKLIEKRAFNSIKSNSIILPINSLSFNSTGFSEFKKLVFLGNNSFSSTLQFVHLSFMSKLSIIPFSNSLIDTSTSVFSYFSTSCLFSLAALKNKNFKVQKRLLVSAFNNLHKFFYVLSKIYLHSWVVNLFFIGVGYKVFIFNNFLYLRLGFSKMLKLEIPKNILILTRKRNHLRIFSSNLACLTDFTKVLMSLRSFDKYKGKGVYKHSDFSSIKLKTGKKQQFF